MNKIFTPSNMAALLLILTIWLPTKFLPEGTSLSLGIGNTAPQKMTELDLTTVTMPDVRKHSLRQIIDIWDCEIGFWNRAASVGAYFSKETKPSHYWASYDCMEITRLKYDDDTNTVFVKLRGEKDMERYGVHHPSDDPTYLENHLHQILARAFMRYARPVVSQKGTAPYSWPVTGAFVESTLYNDCKVVIQYELSVLKGKMSEWKGTMTYDGRKDLLAACDYSYYELAVKDKSMHFGDNWRISQFLTE